MQWFREGILGGSHIMRSQIVPVEAANTSEVMEKYLAGPQVLFHPDRTLQTRCADRFSMFVALLTDEEILGGYGGGEEENFS